MNFSQRIGKEPIDKPLQIDSMSIELRNSLWNYTYEFFADNWIEHIKYFYSSFFRLPVDEVPSTRPIRARGEFKKLFMALDWNKVYEFIELFISYFLSSLNSDRKAQNEFDLRINEELNTILTREYSGYRLSDGKFVKITDNAELSTIEDAKQSSHEKYPNIFTHLDKALTLMSERTNPDYRNSIKESISAVEGICKTLTGEKSGGIGKAMEKLSTDIGMHNAMKDGFKKMYAYTSNEDGIRHAILEQSEVGFAEAKYILVICSAFVYFVIQKIDVEV